MRFQCLSEEIAAAPVPMEITPPQRMLSACAGVLMTGVIVTPMDVVKTRVQAAQAEAVSRHAAASRPAGGYSEPCDKCRQQGRPYTTSARATAMAGAGGAVRQRPPALPSGTLAALNHIARWEGPRGLYRGLDISMVMAIPATVIYYTVYDDFLARLEKAGAGKLVAPSVAGSTARVLATMCMAPLELVRTRVQSEKVAEEVVIGAARGGGKEGAGGVFARLPLVSVGRALATVFREEGAAALWRGVGTTMWRDVPFSMVYWLGYENLKTGFGCGRGSHREGRGGGGGRGRQSPAEERGSADFLLRSFTAGALSGGVASLLTHPFDVVKTQQQVVLKGFDTDGGCEHRPPPPKRKPPGTFDVMRSIVDSRGPAGLFTGALARVGKVAPACAIMMFSYEAGKRFFGQRNTEAAAAAAAARRQ